MITNKLRSADLKSTFQREKILEYLSSRKEHPTVDMIYKYMLSIYPSISKTTVYNTVKSLDKAGLIKAVKFCSKGEVIYDGNPSVHYHFVCKECGKIFDLDLDCKNIIKKEINGHKVEDICAYFSGICKECKNKVKI